MAHFVPQWDGMSSHSCSKFFDDAHVRQFAKGGAHPQHHPALQKKSSACLVPDQDALEVSLTQMGIQGDVGSHLSADEVNHTSIPALDMSLVMTNPCFHDDEMVSWLQYPLEDSLDRNYCSDMFGELMNPHVHLVKDTFVHQTMREPERTNDLQGLGHEQAELHQLRTARTSMPCARFGAKSDEAMAMGAGRAAGLVSQTGSEVFTCVRTHVHPAVSLKPSSSCVTESFFDGKKNLETYDPMISLLGSKEALVIPSATPVPSSVSNFAHFSRPLATTMEALRIVGAASGPTNVERARQPAAKTLPVPCEPPSASESNGSVVMSMQPSSRPPTRLSSQSEIVRDGIGCTVTGWSLPTATLCGSDMLQCRPVVRMLNETAELNSHGTYFTGSATTVSEDVPRTEATDTTVSPSRLSGSSNEEASDEPLTLTPKKKASLEYTEDAEDFTANARKPPPGPSATKRSRAAETHNESEKKRRNKINVRLKALQSLIPNSNKTDKASVLDEAIEYTKMLQAQLQFMSMRTGMLVPQLMIPGGMHYVPVGQMPIGPLGIGMGYGVGSDMDFRMCVADINAAAAGLGVTGAGAGAGAVVNLSPTFNQLPLIGQAYVGARPQQISSVPLSHHASLCMPTTGMDKMMLPQQPLQCAPVNVQVNAGMYSALAQQRLPQESRNIGQPQENDS